MMTFMRVPNIDSAAELLLWDSGNKEGEDSEIGGAIEVTFCWRMTNSFS